MNDFERKVPYKGFIRLVEMIKYLPFSVKARSASGR